jgi:mono/diheme cytochrome c family protein
MKKIKLSVVLFATLFFASCGGNSTDETAENDASNEHAQTEEVVEEAPVEEVVVEEAVEATDAIDMDNKGIGPISSVELGDIDDALVGKGKETFKANCTACHKIKKRFVGPALKGITERRSPEWIMNMILNPEGMVAEDPIAMALLAEYSSPMANQSLSEDEARAILEYLRTKN